MYVTTYLTIELWFVCMKRGNRMIYANYDAIDAQQSDEYLLKSSHTQQNTINQLLYPVLVGFHFHQFHFEC